MSVTLDVDYALGSTAIFRPIDTVIMAEVLGNCTFRTCLQLFVVHN